MSIKVKQTCDKCGKERDLNVGYHGGRSTIDQAGRVSGWLTLRVTQHMCPECVAKVLPQ